MNKLEFQRLVQLSFKTILWTCYKTAQGDQLDNYDFADDPTTGYIAKKYAKKVKLLCEISRTLNWFI